MDKDGKENVFLIEIIVDRLEMESKCGATCSLLKGKVTMEFRFLKPGQLCTSNSTEEGEERFKCLKTIQNGNSCLFSMTSPNIKDALDNFDVFVDVFKEIKDTKISIGKNNYSLSSLFTHLLQEAIKNGIPCSKITREDFDLNDDLGLVRGNLSFFVRLSCFGKMSLNGCQDIPICCTKSMNFNKKIVQNSAVMIVELCCCCNKPIRNGETAPVASNKSINCGGINCPSNKENKAKPEHPRLSDKEYNGSPSDKQNQANLCCPCNSAKKKKKIKKKKSKAKIPAGLGAGCVWIDRCPPAQSNIKSCYKPCNSGRVPSTSFTAYPYRTPCSNYRNCCPSENSSYYCSNYC